MANNSTSTGTQGNKKAQRKARQAAKAAQPATTAPASNGTPIVRSKPGQGYMGTPATAFAAKVAATVAATPKAPLHTGLTGNMLRTLACLAKHGACTHSQMVAAGKLPNKGNQLRPLAAMGLVALAPASPGPGFVYSITGPGSKALASYQATQGK